MQANLDVLSWSLSDADMTALSRLAEVAPQRMVDGSFWLSEQVSGKPKYCLALYVSSSSTYSPLDAVRDLYTCGTGWRLPPNQLKPVELSSTAILL
jgi:hypothetical protein